MKQQNVNKPSIWNRQYEVETCTQTKFLKTKDTGKPQPANMFQLQMLRAVFLVLMDHYTF